MKERTQIFQDKYNGLYLPVTTLRKLYLSNGIKRKRVRQLKIRPQSTQSRQVQEEKTLYEQLTKARRMKLPIVYLDEVNFTKQSIQKLDWSGRHSNISVDQRQIYTG